jgi:hypothetical protein
MKNVCLKTKTAYWFSKPCFMSLEILGDDEVNQLLLETQPAMPSASAEGGAVLAEEDVATPPDEDVATLQEEEATVNREVAMDITLPVASASPVSPTSTANSRAHEEGATKATSKCGRPGKYNKHIFVSPQHFHGPCTPFQFIYGYSIKICLIIS